VSPEKRRTMTFLRVLGMCVFRLRRLSHGARGTRRKSRKTAG
jgi:hypothetical protein